MTLVRSFHEPDESEDQGDGLVLVEIIYLGQIKVKRVTHRPGWRWSLHSGPKRGLERCPDTHVGILMQGQLAVESADGNSFVASSGDLLVIRPGHDAWTVGDESAVLIQFDEGNSAAKRFELV